MQRREKPILKPSSCNTGEMEILAALEIKKMLVDRLVNLLSRGYVLPVVKYMAQCWRHADTDISLIRSTELDYFFFLSAAICIACVTYK